MEPLAMAIGLKFGANFKVEDRLGAIFDYILYKQGSFFNPKRFPHSVNVNLGEKILENQTTGDTLRINNSNIIATIHFKDNKLTAEDIFKGFENDIIKGVVKKFKIEKIDRLGVVFYHGFQNENFVNNIISKFDKTLDDNLDEFNVRFAKTLPSNDATTKRNVNDYDKVIRTVDTNKSTGKATITVDYQRYFRPNIMIGDKFNTSSFYSIANNYRQNKFSEWCKSLGVEG